MERSHLGSRRCKRGEIFSGLTCELCPKGFYHIEDDSMRADKLVCHTCPIYCLCSGGDKIIPFNGYLWKDENQTNIIKCLDEEAFLEVKPQ